MEDFSDKRVALITGASRGLGAAIALELAAQGLVVAINYLTSGSAADHLCQRIRDGGGQARAFQADVREESDVAGLCAQVLNAFGRTDILVVNATGPQPMLSIEQQTWQSYLDQLEFFVKSPLLLLKQVLPGMRTRRFGRIIQIGSEVFEIGNPSPTTIMPGWTVFELDLVGWGRWVGFAGGLDSPTLDVKLRSVTEFKLPCH